MPGPWEQYKPQQQQAQGPWSKFAQSQVKGPPQDQPSGNVANAMEEKAGGQKNFRDQTQDFIHGKDSPEWDAMSQRAMATAGGVATSSLTPGAAGLKSFFGRMGTSTGLGATAGAIQSAPDTTTRLKNAALGAAKGAAFGLGGEALNTGSNFLADRLELGATGSKGGPGEGNRLVDMGIRGSRQTMSDQIPPALDSEEKELQGLLAVTQGTGSSKDMADQVRQENMRRFIRPSGNVNPNLQPEVDQVRQFSSNLEANGPELSPQDLLAAKREGEWPGYTASGTKAQTLEGMMGRSQANYARDRLDTLTKGQSSDKLANQQALINGGKALGKEPTEGLIPSLIAAKTGVPRAVTKGIMAQGIAPVMSYGAAGLQNGVAPAAQNAQVALPLSQALKSLFDQENSK